MGLIAKAVGGDYQPISEGVHVATCYAVIDLGTHVSDKFKDKTGAWKEQRKVLIQWEIPSERIDVEREGRTVSMPRAISKKYTLSLHVKADLRKALEAWRGKGFTDQELCGFDLKHILGKSCQMQVVHDHADDGRTYANVGALMALPRGSTGSRAENPLAFFSFDDWDGNPEAFSTSPEWVAEIIRKSKEYNTPQAEDPPLGDPPAADAQDEALPF